MREIVVDLTATCINRTAIRHVAFDTYAALAERFDVTPQYLGKRATLADRAAERGIAESFFRSIPRWAAVSVHADEIGLFVREDEDLTPRLYFDPIYVLSRDLHSHDVVFVLDMTTLTNPEWHESGVAFVYERAFRKLLASAARIVCISDHCAAALRTSFAIPKKHIVTVPLYPRKLPTQDLAAPTIPIEPKRFFLFVGSLETRKNLAGLMQAFAQTGLAAEGWRLVIAGGRGHGNESIETAAADLAGVELLGFVTDEVLAWLYENAAAFAYPSFLEGFGVPLLEALAHGLPCLASITGASREICGPGELLVDPYHVPSIAAGLIDCARRAGREDPQAGAERQARARRFTFDRYMEALLPVFDREAA